MRGTKVQLALVLALAMPMVTGYARGASTVPDNDSNDPFLWLEDVGSPRSMNWVRAHDAVTLSNISADPHYKPFFDQALAIAQAKDRIPVPKQAAGGITNFWQDAEHVRGLWRRTTEADYSNPDPHWTTLIDVDALAAAEHTNAVFKGANCREPAERLCLVIFSDGGEDAESEREFDVSKRAFVEGGFAIPRAKHEADWVDDDTLIVTTDWGPGSMTTSGYPFILKRLKRGQKLEQAVEVFRGKPTDVQVAFSPHRDGDGNQVQLIERGIDFFHTEFYRIEPSGLAMLPIPEKADAVGLVQNRLVVKVEEDVKLAGGGKIPGGSIISYDMGHIDAPPVAIFQPGPRQSVGEVAVTKDHVLATVYDNVVGRAYSFTAKGDAWAASRLALPDDVSVRIVSTTITNDRVYLGVTGFLTPNSLWLADLSKDDAPVQIKTTPARFDASRDIVEQFDVASSDGTKIPYFVVHPRDMKNDGENPSLLTAYGGFEVSRTPTYQPSVGKLWLENGGVYVLANIRGGGEFGPSWHEAALKTHRQVAYDDFAAVAQDLVTRRITSPRRLGIEGESNGGLLMGVEFEQHPELWNAVIIGVPLLDMLRYEQIAAGASWVGEYGTVADPGEHRFLASISPYANLKAGVRYPEPFIFTTTKDDRVGPVHARKFAARMEAMGLPFQFYEATEGGHGAGVNAAEVAREQALEMTYLTRKLMH